MRLFSHSQRAKTQTEKRKKKKEASHSKITAAETAWIPATEDPSFILAASVSVCFKRLASLGRADNEETAPFCCPECAEPYRDGYLPPRFDWRGCYLVALRV